MHGEPVLPETAFPQLTHSRSLNGKSAWRRPTSLSRDENHKHILPFASVWRVLAEEIVRLYSPERLALIGELWDSLEHEQLPLSSAQWTEFDRRLRSTRAGRKI